MDSQKRPGDWFVKACRSLGPLKIKDAKEALSKEERRHISTMHDLRAEEATADERKKKSIAKRRHSEKKRHETTKRKILQPDFTDATYYLGMDLRPEETVRLAAFVAGLSMIGMMILYTTLIRMWPELQTLANSYLLPAVFATPLLLFAFLSSYPEILAKRMQALSLGRTPEPINYMTMSLRTSPSLERAVVFAAEHSDEPMSTHLKRVSWEVAMREHSTIERSLSEFAYRCGKWNDDFKRSLYALRGAALEHTPEGFERSLERAHNIALTGAKEKVESFASRLSGPSTVLFALGIVLPMMMGAIIPLQGMQLPTAGTVEGAVVKSSAETMFPIVVGMDVVFPLVTLLYAHMILGRRPGTSSPPYVEGKKESWILVIAVGIGVLPLLLYTSVLDRLFPYVGENIGNLPLLLSVSFTVGAYLILYSLEAHKRRKLLLSMERDLPDALFQLGNRIAEGEPLETAFGSTARTMESSPLAPLFKKISSRLTMSHDTLEGVLFGTEGVLVDLESRGLNANMRSLLEAVKKDHETAGKTILHTANYMKDLQKVEHEISIRLQGVVDMMKTTSLFFAPIVMGVTVAMYAMLSGQFTTLGSSNMMSAEAFAMVLGVYLLLSTAITSYFVTGIKGGMDKLSLARDLGIGLPLSMSLFILSVVGGNMFIG